MTDKTYTIFERNAAMEAKKTRLYNEFMKLMRKYKKDGLESNGAYRSLQNL